MRALESQITSLTIVYSTFYADADQRKHQSSASLALVWGIHRWPVNSPHKGPVTRKIFPFDDVIMYFNYRVCGSMKVHWVICYASYLINLCPYPMWPHTSAAKLLTASHDRRVLAGWSIHHSWRVCLLPLSFRRTSKYLNMARILHRQFYNNLWFTVT